jgi:predicted DNA-binding transcriptional regulator YafY
MAKAAAPERERAVQILRDLLEGRKHSRHTIAKLLDVQPSTADRWMKTVELVPGVVRVRRGRQSLLQWRRPETAPAKLMAVLAACVAGSVEPLFANTTWQGNIREFRDHLVRNSARPESFDAINRKFLFVANGGEPLAERSEDLDQVIDAIWKSKRLRFQYRHNDGRAEAVSIEPLSLAIYGRQFYVLGRADADRVYPFRFSRMTRPVLESATFPYPTQLEYDPQALLANSIGLFMTETHPVRRVRLRLRGPWAAYAQSHRWHANQQVRIDGDAAVVTLTVRVCPELEALILSFGEFADVLEPLALRRRIDGRLRSAAESLARRKGEAPRPGPTSTTIRSRSPSATRVAARLPTRRN